MKSTVQNSMLAVSLLAALAATIPVVAQSGQTAGPRYRLIELGTLGGTYSQPFYVSSKGVTSGEASLADGNWHAILYQGRFKTDLGTLGGLNSSAFGSPNAIGQVVGAAETSHTDPNGEDFCGFYGSGAPWVRYDMSGLFVARRLDDSAANARRPQRSGQCDQQSRRSGWQCGDRDDGFHLPTL